MEYRKKDAIGIQKQKTGLESELAALVSQDADKKMVYSRQCLVECCLTGDLNLARTLIQDHKDQLSWSLPLCVTMAMLLGHSKVNSKEPLLQRIRAECGDYDWSGDNVDKITGFVSTIVSPDKVTQTLVKCAALMIQSLSLSQSQPQQSLAHMATCLDQLSSCKDRCYQLLLQLFPQGVSDAPSLGSAVLGRQLDWQCNWLEVRSIMATHAAVTLTHWRHNPGQEVTEEQLTDIADAVMLEDVIKRQKLEAEAPEAFIEVSDLVQGGTPHGSLPVITVSCALHLYPLIQPLYTLSPSMRHV